MQKTDIRHYITLSTLWNHNSRHLHYQYHKSGEFKFVSTSGSDWG